MNACFLPFVLASVALLVGCKPPPVVGDDASKGIVQYVGKNLYTEDFDIDEFDVRFEALTGDPPRDKFSYDSLRPYAVSRFNAGKAKWIVLEVYPGRANPDVSAVGAHIFDAGWKRLAKSIFPTGYRYYLTDASIQNNADLGQDLLVATVTSSGPFILLPDGEQKPAFEQGDFQRQYYALLGDRVALVRLEDNEQRFVPNSYRWSVPMKGGSIPERTGDEWIASLDSDNPCEQLATLVWLSGSHLSSAEPRHENVNQESIEDAKLFETVRDSPRTKAAIETLRTSTTKWVREAADATLAAIENNETE